MFKRIVLSVLVLLPSLLIMAQANIAKAQVNSCSVSLDTHSVAPNSSSTVQFQLTNTDVNPITWIRITRPSDNYSITSNYIDGWIGSTEPTYAYESDGVLNPGDTANITVQVQAADTQTSPESWIVEATDTPGSNLVSCTSGDLSEVITGTPADITPPNIYNVSVSQVGSDNVIVNWTTDEPSTSQVNYGSDTSYGSSTTEDTNLVTDHQVTVNDLSPDTAYHYQVLSNDASNNMAASSDNTFLTTTSGTGSGTGPGSGSGTKGGTGSSGSNNINQAPLNFQVTDTSDKTPPTISITSPIPKVAQVPPTVKGTATDNTAVVRIEYSVDGGQDWLPVDSATPLGGKKVDFSFTPTNLDDGNYHILARAIDPGGNITATPQVALVIDRLPPLVGGGVVSIGPQVLQPDENGVIKTLVGSDQKITFSAVGGPTSVTLNAVSTNPKIKPKSFSLTRTNDNPSLWSGIVSFEIPGTYTVAASSIDGNANRTNKVLNSFYVIPSSKVVEQGSAKPAAATVTVHYLEPESGNWLVWDASAYNQQNPQKTDKNGQFNLLLPAGKYYLTAKGNDHQVATSKIFSLEDSTPISTTLELKPGLKLGPINLPWFNFSTQDINLSNTPQSKNLGNSLVGDATPALSTNQADGKTINTLDWLGKPTVLTFMSTWAPGAVEQMSILNQLQTNKDINVIPVASQESANMANVYSQTAGYNLNWLADPDSVFTGKFGVSSLPVSYFIDRNGVIKHVAPGVLSKQQILSSLSGL